MALTRLRDPALVRAWYLARSDEYAARIRALASIYNAAVPINLLPPEVLMMVFSYLSLRIRTFVRYLLVCRTWTALILRTHPFWVNLLRNAIGLDILGNKASRAQYGSFLSRTGALSVSLSTDGYVAELAPLLARHARRIVCWESRLYTPEEVVSLSELLAGGLPTLQTLIVRDAYDDPFSRFRGDVQEDHEFPSFLLFSHPLIHMHTSVSFLFPGICSLHPVPSAHLQSSSSKTVFRGDLKPMSPWRTSSEPCYLRFRDAPPPTLLLHPTTTRTQDTVRCVDVISTASASSGRAASTVVWLGTRLPLRLKGGVCTASPTHSTPSSPSAHILARRFGGCMCSFLRRACRQSNCGVICNSDSEVSSRWWRLRNNPCTDITDLS
ncbi:hypothetical protein OH76DRAFT_1407554 [Lentinus brumalis]|uniref:F-box domain-containing protein n=1 Tax=Lentinus brumalis TaxID=2498619 RepID=A0A371CZS4_9APHY|nr:hypothetical protein OH76DRAFT_1407554 [Polyporus brumalis]